MHLFLPVSTKISEFASKLGSEVAFDKLYNPKNNAFDFFRFTLASLVIYSHAYPLLYGTTVMERLATITKGQDTFGGLAVAGFFSISGFLVTQSFINSVSYKAYFIKRLLRLMPALIASSFLTAFMLGPILSNLSFRGFMLGDIGVSPFAYFIKNSSMNILGYSYALRDLFTNNPYPVAVNGSLWTIKHEFVAYILIMVLGFFSFIKHRRLFGVFTTLVIILYFLNHINGYVLWDLPSPKWWAFHSVEYPFLLKLISYFMVGSSFFIWKDRIIFSWKFIFLAVIIYFLAILMRVYIYSNLFVLPYVLIGLSLKWHFSNFSKYGDFSYGIYIYAFPVQQTVAYFFSSQIRSAALFAIISFIITLGLAVFSWYFVERPALGLKKYLAKNASEQ